MNKLVAEWIPYMKAYRVYDPHKPQDTVVYEKDEDRLEEEGVAICDAEHDACGDLLKGANHGTVHIEI